MDSKELYKKAYNLHYSELNYSKALEIYKKIIKEFPESKEADYSKQQIEHITNRSLVEKNRHKKTKITENKELSDKEVNEGYLTQSVLKELTKINERVNTISWILLIWFIFWIINIIFMFITGKSLI